MRLAAFFTLLLMSLIVWAQTEELNNTFSNDTVENATYPGISDLNDSVFLENVTEAEDYNVTANDTIEYGNETTEDIIPPALNYTVNESISLENNTLPEMPANITFENESITPPILNLTLPLDNSTQIENVTDVIIPDNFTLTENITIENITLPGNDTSDVINITFENFTEEILPLENSTLPENITVENFTDEILENSALLENVTDIQTFTDLVFDSQTFLDSDHERPTLIGMANPAALYCSDLGYEWVKISLGDGEDAVCVLPDGSECLQWDFLDGKCGTEYNLCGVNDLDTIVVQDDNNPLSLESAVCTQKKSRVNALEGTALVGAKVIDSLDLVNKAVSGRVNDHVTQSSSKSSAETIESQELQGDIPSSFDWRDAYGQHWPSPVRNQGICGSCWAFAAVAVVEAQYNIAYDDPSLDLDLSEQYLNSDCFAYFEPSYYGYVGSCCGGWADTALSYFISDGVPDEACMTYVDGSGCSCSGTTCSVGCSYRPTGWPYWISPCSDRTCSNRCGDYASRLVTLDNGYYVNEWPNAADRADIKAGLIEYGPLTVSLDMSEYSTGTKTCATPSGTDHAVLLVGYDDSASEWIIKNSWGSTWNGDGYFRLKYGGCNMETSDIVSAVIDSSPKLAGEVTHSSGSSSTLFNFTANYKHMGYTEPTSIQVYIGGTPYNMEEVDSADEDTRDNKTYYYNRTLSAGTYSYYFTTSDGTYTNTTSSQDLIVGFAPTLSAPQVTPSSGSTSTVFNYTVVYVDADNDAPSYIYAVIDGGNNVMSGNSTDYDAGVLYNFGTTLASVTHNYFFNTSDGFYRNETVLVLDSPTISSEPILSTPQVTPTLGATSTWFNFTVTYRDADDDAPTQKNLVLDGSNYVMQDMGSTYSSGVLYYFNTSLSTGTHSYKYSFSDGTYSVLTSTTSNPKVYSPTPTCDGASTNELHWLINTYTNCTGTALIPTSTRTGYLNITAGNTLNLTNTYVYLNNTMFYLDGTLLVDGSTLDFII